jgi:hypothetical protein
MFLKIEILLIPLQANSHIFEINEEVESHPYTMTMHETTLDFANAFFSPGINS